MRRPQIIAWSGSNLEALSPQLANCSGADVGLACSQQQPAGRFGQPSLAVLQAITPATKPIGPNRKLKRSCSPIMLRRMENDKIAQGGSE